MRIMSVLLLFIVTWLLWSGHYTPLLLALGLVSCLLVLVLSLRTGFFHAELYAFHLGPRLPRYWAWLLWEIVKSNVAVARIVLDPRLPISPCLITVDARDVPLVGQATLANSITLTPGTLSVDIDHGRIEVHCLARKFAQETAEGEMLIRAKRLTED